MAGTRIALRLSMIIRSLDELRVYQKALTAADAVSAIIGRPSFEKDRKLKEQLSASSSRVPACARKRLLSCNYFGGVSK